MHLMDAKMEKYLEWEFQDINLLDMAMVDSLNRPLSSWVAKVMVDSLNRPHSSWVPKAMVDSLNRPLSSWVAKVMVDSLNRPHSSWVAKVDSVNHNNSIKDKMFNSFRVNVKALCLSHCL
eukprot:NODE_6409_length_538_cov_26.861314_g6244_i0.p2 GENE.NODE_6409_length_538_cov_26.861314_g6244_i0~~NODE_6409_length_538_cov_26.861314_g6244_i0.p2  ORF type:complete len:120 (-),score=30.09 NODE_6409_length_538_cov_26.861314_g6244_i0:56-415(-)